MGRSAGWLAYGAAIAGEASLVISVEDITGKYETSEEFTDPETGKTTIRRVMDLDEVVKRIVATMRVREEAEGKEFGVIVMAEGLAEFLPHTHIEGVPRDEHGHIAISQAEPQPAVRRPGRQGVHQADRPASGRSPACSSATKCRCARPQAFDVMLGSQLGVGAYRALVEKRLDGVMVSVSGQLELNYVPFNELVDPATLVTVVRYIEPGSRFPPPGAVPGDVRERVGTEWYNTELSVFWG